MTIGQLKAVIATYCNRSVADMTVNGTDMLLVALNSVRLELEQGHDFVFTQVLADITIDDKAGASLSTSVIHGTETPVRLKSIIDIGISMPDGHVQPMRFQAHRSAHSQTLELNGFEDTYDNEVRYPSDSDLSSGRRGRTSIVQHGDMLYLYPGGIAGQTTDLTLSGYKWLNEYTADADSDFLTDRAYNYLKWASICELNHLTKEYVMREEGNLPPPEKYKQAAYEAMVAWDNFIVTT